jgi:hypothetical protein
MSVSGVKSSANAFARGVDGLRPGLADQRGLDRGGAFRHAGHAAEGDAGLGDGAVLHGDVERAADGRDVLVEALRQLVAAQPVGLDRERDRLDEFARARGPVCRSRGRSPPAAARAARRPCAGAASRPARSAAAGCPRWASRWRCCRPPWRRCAPAPSRSGGSSRQSSGGGRPSPRAAPSARSWRRCDPFPDRSRSASGRRSG